MSQFIQEAKLKMQEPLNPRNNINNIDKVNGLIKCEILPPRNLYHPVLPVKMHGKLICRKCVEDKVQEDCMHENEKDKVFSGTWVYKSGNIKSHNMTLVLAKRVYFQDKLMSFSNRRHLYPDFL